MCQRCKGEICGTRWTVWWSPIGKWFELSEPAPVGKNPSSSSMAHKPCRSRPACTPLVIAVFSDLYLYPAYAGTVHLGLEPMTGILSRTCWRDKKVELEKGSSKRAMILPCWGLIFFSLYLFAFPFDARCSKRVNWTRRSTIHRTLAVVWNAALWCAR